MRLGLGLSIIGLLVLAACNSSTLTLARAKALDARVVLPPGVEHPERFARYYILMRPRDREDLPFSTFPPGLPLKPGAPVIAATFIHPNSPWDPAGVKVVTSVAEIPRMDAVLDPPVCFEVYGLIEVASGQTLGSWCSLGPDGTPPLYLRKAAR